MSKHLHPASAFRGAVPKVEQVRPCFCAAAGFVTMENGREEHVSTSCHRASGHEGQHRGWAVTLTKSKVRISWKNEER